MKILWHISRQTTIKYYYLFCVVRVYTREIISIKLRITSVFVGCKRVSRWSKMQFVLSHKRGTKNVKIRTILFNYQLKIYSVDTMDDSSRWWLYREKYMGARRYGISLRTGERSEQVRCRVEHEKRNFISVSNHVWFCLSYKHNNPVLTGKVNFINEWKWRIDNPLIKLVNSETPQKQTMGVIFNTRNSQLLTFTYRQKKFFRYMAKICLWKNYQSSIFVFSREKCNH